VRLIRRGGANIKHDVVRYANMPDLWLVPLQDALFAIFSPILPCTH
jgi:hypothetical protein